jgi:hypothetical protein
MPLRGIEHLDLIPGGQRGLRRADLAGVALGGSEQVQVLCRPGDQAVAISEPAPAWANPVPR